MGINNAMYKSWTFGVSAFYTGVAGALGAIIIQFVAPDSFTFFLAVLFLVGSVVGGIVSIPGAIFGGIFVTFIPNISEQLATRIPGVAEEAAKGLTWTVYGVFLILIIYVAPAGLAGLLRMLLARLVRR
jgi:branched-chain amino acid transport system permease protein